ncbi:MAG TPA: glycerate kinase [Crinalium sp.]
MADPHVQTFSGQDDWLARLLQHLVRGEVLSVEDKARLEAALLHENWQCQVFGITADTVHAVVTERSQLLQDIYPALTELCRDRLGWQTVNLALFWNLWLPLALAIVAYRQQQRQPLIQGILGVQGTGKTTLAIIVTLILDYLGYRVCSLSLDDLYKTYAERCQLQIREPRLRWRGPPGTHDIDMGLMVLNQLRTASSHPVQIPRFDKSLHQGAGDRTMPEVVSNIDVVLFEGWFVGVRPIDPAAFDQAPPPIVTEGDRQFARDCNTRLQDYLPLWDLLDRLIVLYPSDYHLSQQWRQQAEQRMIDAGRSGMTDREVSQFVEYFWRSLHPELFIKPLLHDAQHVDLVVDINPDRSRGAVYQPRIGG